MKRIIPIAVVLAILGGFVWTARFLYLKSRRAPVVYETRTPTTTDITVVTVATGALVPRQEIELKPRVSGVVEALYVEPGAIIERGQNIAKIRIIPDVVRLNQAEAQVRAAQLAIGNAERELARSRDLHAKQVISETELSRFQYEFDLRKQELDAARSNLQLIREGASRNAGVASNMVTSTVAGTVLEVPVEVGVSVIESNTFNAGTTVATVADMTDMIFKGTVDESEVGKIREGMPLEIKIGALEDVVLSGTLEYISPKGVAEEGVIKFEIRAAIDARTARTARTARAGRPGPGGRQGRAGRPGSPGARPGEPAAAATDKPAAPAASDKPAAPADTPAAASASAASASDAAAGDAAAGDTATVKGVTLRANYSANANIVLDRREQVMAISESLLQFEDGKPYVEVEVAPQVFERRDVQVGLSDGIHIEVLSGLDADAKIKKHQGTKDGDGEGRGPRGRRGGGSRS